MIAIITTILLATLFFMSGYIVQALKKIISLLVKIILTILSFFGVKFKAREKSLKMSDEFKNTYKEIKVVKLSNKNLKEKSSIDWLNLGLFCASLLLIVSNLAVLSGNAISNWLYSLIQNIKIVKSATDMNTLYTATLFSALSFSATKLLQRWKETKQQRIEKKELKLKLKALELMDSKELLEQAKKKDEKRRKELS